MRGWGAGWERALGKERGPEGEGGWGLEGERRPRELRGGCGGDSWAGIPAPSHPRLLSVPFGPS